MSFISSVDVIQGGVTTEKVVISLQANLCEPDQTESMKEEHFGALVKKRDPGWRLYTVCRT